MNTYRDRYDFRPDIEGLRGVAILLVVAFHCGAAAVQGGFVGVDVFFVLSGYLITGLLVNEVAQTSRLDLLHFYSRRIRRLLPGSALMLAVTILASVILLSPTELSFMSRAARAAAVYGSNIFFSTRGSDYFAPSVVSNPVLHTWTLAVEEQFYLFWPLIIMVCLQACRSKKILSSMFFTIALASFAACVWMTPNGRAYAFYQLPTRAWEFALGGLAVLIPKGMRLPPRIWITLGWIGFGAVLYSSYSIVDVERFPGWIASVPVLGTASILLSGAQVPDRGLGLVLASRPLQFLGKLSYSWYLWHWPFLVLAKALYPNITILGNALVALGALITAAVTYYVWENPIRVSNYLVARPLRAVYAGIAITVLSVATATAAVRVSSRLAAQAEMVRIRTTMDDISRLPWNECVTLGKSVVRTCEFGVKKSDVQVVLFGDSHAIQWFNPLQRIADARRWRLTTMVKTLCPAADIRAPGRRARTSTCDDWRSNAISKIIESRPAAVFIADASVYMSRVDRPTDHTFISLEDWQSATRRSLQAFADANVPVVMVRDIPYPTFDVPACVARSVRVPWFPGGTCQMARSAVLNPAIFDAQRAAAQGLQNVSFVDLSDQLCDKDTCFAVQNSEIMYRDNNHLTGKYADGLASTMEARLPSFLTGLSPTTSAISVSGSSSTLTLETLPASGWQSRDGVSDTGASGH